MPSEEITHYLNLLKDPDETVRANAAKALGNIGDGSVLPALCEALRDPYCFVGECATIAIGRIRAVTVPGLAEAIEAAESKDHERAEQALPFLLSALRTTEEFLREVVVASLAATGASALPGLLEALHDPDGFVRGSAATALGRIGDLTTVPALLEQLQDTHSYARGQIAEALGGFGSTLVPLLQHALRDPRTRSGAVATLGSVGDASVTPTLLALLQNADTSLSDNVFQAIRRIGPTALPFILKALHDPYEFTRASAVQALNCLRNDFTVPLLLEALHDPGRYGRVRSHAARHLGALKEQSATHALVELLQDAHESVRDSAVSALGRIANPSSVPALIASLHDRSWLVRRSAADALAGIGAPAVPALQAALQDPDSEVRRYAEKALQQIDSHNDDRTN